MDRGAINGCDWMRWVSWVILVKDDDGGDGDGDGDDGCSGGAAEA